MSARRTVTVEGVTWEYVSGGAQKTANFPHHRALNRIAELEAQVARFRSLAERAKAWCEASALWRVVRASAPKEHGEEILRALAEEAGR